MPLQLTAAQASAVTGLSLKAINKAIDLQTIPSTAKAKNGVRKRYVSEPALICLKLEAKGLSQLPLSFRKRIFRLVLTHPEVATVRPVDAVQIDVEQARREVKKSIDELKLAEEMVTSDAEVMGGVPVVSGTRIPISTVSDMLSQGVTAEEIVEGYPSLSTEQVRLAQVYTLAHPRRGRPTAVRPWASSESGAAVRKSVRPLAVAAAR